MARYVYYEKVQKEDGRYVIEVKSKGTHETLMVSTNSYSSSDDCDRVIVGLDSENNGYDEE